MAAFRHGQKKRQKYPQKMLPNVDQLTRFPFTPHMPLLNPLSAKDDGEFATIDIQSFDMQIPGRRIFLASGSILFVPHQTICHVYLDDSEFPTRDTIIPVYHASKSKITAGIGGRFFVGSILTPAKGGSPTIGNGDGGTFRLQTEPHGVDMSFGQPGTQMATTQDRNAISGKSWGYSAGTSRDPEVAKRRVLVMANPHVPGTEMCEIFDRDKVPLPSKWQAAGIRSWSSAYKNLSYRRRIQVIMTKDRLHG